MRSTLVNRDALLERLLLERFGGFIMELNTPLLGRYPPLKANKTANPRRANIPF